MITLTLKTSETYKFNLKDFDREQSLCEMIQYLTEYDPSRTLLITTDLKEKLKIPIKSIDNCIHHKSIYIHNSTVHTN